MIGRKVKLIDTVSWDDSHAIGHSSTVDQVKAVAERLDRTGVGLIELSHEDGTGGSSTNYGFSAVDKLTLSCTAGGVIKNAKLTMLLLSGVDTIEGLKRTEETGIGAVRMAAHVIEADILVQHIRYAKGKGLFVVEFLMTPHMAESKKIVEQARIFEAEGVDHVNLTDSAGHILPNDVHRRITALRESVSAPIGFHAHNDMGLAMGNSLAALEAGIEYLDGIHRGPGAGVGNTQMEVLYAVLNRTGYDIHADIYQMMNVVQTTAEPSMYRPQAIRADSLVLGCVGVYPGFLLHARRATKQFGIDIEDILIESGRRGMIGGQEDMIVDVAYELSKNRFRLYKNIKQTAGGTPAVCLSGPCRERWRYEEGRGLP